MAPIASALRRILFLLLLAGAMGAAASWWRGRSSTPTPAQPPQWPEWPLAPERSQTPEQPVWPEPPASAVRSPPPEGPAPERAWLPAHADGTAPESHPIKVKLSSGIYHVPGNRFYGRTRPDRCYPTAAAAEADGYRPSKT